MPELLPIFSRDVAASLRYITPPDRIEDIIMVTKPPVLSDEEISWTLRNLLNAYESADLPKLRELVARDVDIHVHELDLYGRSAFMRIYTPERVILTKYTVKSEGTVGWSYGTITRQNMVMHFSAVFRENRRHHWKMVHLHLSDASL